MTENTQPTCCISIDVDSIDCYYRIHALGEPPRGLQSRILTRALPRYAEVFKQHDIQATFFVVAKDIDPEAYGSDATEMRDVVAQLHTLGHEIASHSYSHPYDLARRPRDEVEKEISKAHDLLADLCGKEPVGFRAPGYDVSAEMLQTLLDRRYLYDSSTFPAPGYYAAKAAVMAFLYVRRTQSGAVLTNPRALWAPIDPYRPNLAAPWQRGQAQLLELPIAVTRTTRTPVIGTNVLLAPSWLRRHWLHAMNDRPLFNFELHAIDLCDAVIDDFPKELVARQPDLKRSVADKQRALNETLHNVTKLGFRFATLEQYAKQVLH